MSALVAARPRRLRRESGRRGRRRRDWGTRSVGERRLVRGSAVYRYYDPQTGQFLTVDPLVDQTAQAYGYAAENPVNGVDLSGQSAGTPTLPRLTNRAIWGLALGYLFADAADKCVKSGACNGSSAAAKRLADLVRQSLVHKTKAPPSDVPPDFSDPSKGPPGWIPRGDPASEKGGYVNPDDPNESWSPDLDHLPPIPAHWDHNRRGYPKTRYGPGWLPL